MPSDNAINLLYYTALKYPD